MITFYPSESDARAEATARGLRERALCYVVRGVHLLVFEHPHVPVAGVQVPAGGVEPGETPEEAAVRELLEESAWPSLPHDFSCLTGGRRRRRSASPGRSATPTPSPARRQSRSAGHAPPTVSCSSSTGLHWPPPP
ncbi:NUDIX domain-containing protein [Deinococcus sp.]|uniref:NUDIX domain-containing protein n=1 Tax=Deinococcus sp. TaxID=47478 RepID=UPI002869AB93|nr:NUDIX domain-containing protein [Deinococcus sp.]